MVSQALSLQSLGLTFNRAFSCRHSHVEHEYGFSIKAVRTPRGLCSLSPSSFQDKLRSDHTRQDYLIFILIISILNMKNVLSLAACFALAQARPTSLTQRDVASVTFNGAAGAGYTINVPLDGSSTPTGQSSIPIPTLPPPTNIPLPRQCPLNLFHNIQHRHCRPVHAFHRRLPTRAC